VVDTRKMDGGTREKIVFQSTQGFGDYIPDALAWVESHLPAAR
jgi:hypothetical protein